MSLITLRNICLGSGTDALYENANLVIEPKKRICLIGRNGAGKSTLFKMLQGEVLPNKGEVERQQNLVIAKLVQDIPNDLTGTIFDVVASGLGKAGELLMEHEHLLQALEHDTDPKLFDRLSKVQQDIETHHAWQLDQRVRTILTKMELDPLRKVSQLSGGLIRRVLMARAFVAEPDILLLDEPTNHLDIEAINWLEEYLLSYPKTVIFITHDKRFLQNLATQIVEIDNGKLVSWDSDYAGFLRFKEEQLASEERANELFDKKLAEEERWIRQGVKARRTRNEGRVRALERLRVERQQRRSRPDAMRLQHQEMQLGGKMVFEAEHISYAIPSKPIIKDFSTLIARGDKIGIIGPNGCGKSTLLQLLLGQLQPDSGTVKQGTNLTISYFDQRRAQLDETKTVQENIYDGGDFLTINGKTMHIISYLQDFLFTPQRARTPTKALSGGERNRLVLARLFTKPSNVLVLDEPTNDLDMETLELLQEYLLDYAGTILLVSHDRDFLDKVATSTIVFEGDGKLTEYNGGYQDYMQEKAEIQKAAKSATATKKSTGSTTQTKSSYKEKLELEQLPKKIEALEHEQQQLQQAMLLPDFYKQDKDKITQHNLCLAAIDTELKTAYQRWIELDLQ
jgi:ATP-binding cassette subfamily F protein uup